MNNRPCSLYLDYPSNSADALAAALERGLATRGNSPVSVFFRADDVGVPSATFGRLLNLFQSFEVPLCLAVVPAWLTEQRWRSIQSEWPVDSPLWYWHQHGWRHFNHQTSGKKAEFGEQRTHAAIKTDILAGKHRLETLLGSCFKPVFTPPWNRCTRGTLEILQMTGYRAISRNNARDLPQLDGFADYQVNLDLHTRKELSAPAGLAGLCQELQAGVENGCVGVMLHHQRMNEPAFRLLATLLELASTTRQLVPVNFDTWAAD